MIKRLLQFSVVLQIVWLLATLFVLIEVFSWYLKGSESHRNQAITQVYEKYSSGGRLPRPEDDEFPQMTDEIIDAFLQAEQSTPIRAMPAIGVAAGLGIASTVLTVGAWLGSRRLSSSV